MANAMPPGQAPCAHLHGVPVAADADGAELGIYNSTHKVPLFCSVILHPVAPNEGVTALLSIGRETNIGRERRHERHVLDPRPNGQSLTLESCYKGYMLVSTSIVTKVSRDAHGARSKSVAVT
jgi:hypothetical protein